MCEPAKARVPLWPVAAALAALAVAGPVLAVAANVLALAVVVVYVAAAVGLFGLVRVVRYGSLRKPQRVKLANRARNVAVVETLAALPAPPRAIEAPRTILGVVAATIVPAATSWEGAQRARIPVSARADRDSDVVRDVLGGGSPVGAVPPRPVARPAGRAGRA